MSRIAEDAYWPNLVSLFRVTYGSYGDFFKRIVWGKKCSYHQSTYVVPRLNKICTYRVSQKMPKICVFFCIMSILT
jgi:hypothetical protein